MADAMHCVVVTGSLELLPVLEIEPGFVSDRAMPPLTDDFDRSRWQEWSARCYADAGIGHLDPIEPAAWFFDAFEIESSGLMSRLLDAAIDDAVWRESAIASGENALYEFVAALEGGYALRAEGRVLLSPGCCGDLSNVDSWRRAADEQPSEDMLWTGHPQSAIAFVDGHVRVWQADEDEMRPDGRTEYQLSLDALRSAIDAAELARVRFSDRLAARWNHLFDSRWVAGVCERLTGRLR